MPIVEGALGWALPGYQVTLLNPHTNAPVQSGSAEGEICLPLANRPLGLMGGYLGNPEATARCMRAGYYHTGDMATRDADGLFRYLGRGDDVFKASDYRISPSSWRAYSCGTRPSPMPPWCPHPNPCDWPCPRRTWRSPPATSRNPRPHS